MIYLEPIGRIRKFDARPLCGLCFKGMNMKKTLVRLLVPVLACALGTGSLAGCSLPSAAAQSDPLSAEFYAMDTVMELRAYGDGAQDALDASQAEIASLENLLSRTKEDSEVSALNTAGGAAVSVSPATARLLSASLDYSALTGGAFDITIAPVVSAWGFTTDTYQIPSQTELDALLPLVDYTQVRVRNAADGQGDQVSLGAGQSVDLGGIAKGYASDRLVHVFADNGVESGLAYLGGNVYVCGSKPDGSAWRVAVQDPDDASGNVGVLSLRDAFAVTSGGYQRYFEENGVRYHHIIDPSTGYPANNGLTSVTVVAAAEENAGDESAAGSGTMCDAFSTALFVMGTDKALDFWRANGGSLGFDLVLVTDDARVLVTKGIGSQFEQAEGTDYTYEIIS